MWRLVSMTFSEDPKDEYRCELCGETRVVRLGDEGPTGNGGRGC